MFGIPDTPSQRWARANCACQQGRAWLGEQSIGELWRDKQKTKTRKGAVYLLWVVDHLTRVPEAPGAVHPWVNMLSHRGRLTAKQVRDAAIANGVKIPVELL